MYNRTLMTILISILSVSAAFAQENATADDKIVGDWKVSLTIASEPPEPTSGYTKFFRLSVKPNGIGVLVGKTDSIRAEVRHRDMFLVGTFGRANDEGMIEIDFRFQGKTGEPMGDVVYRGIAKCDGCVLVIALGQAWSNVRPKSFDDVTEAARRNNNHVTLIVLGESPR